MIDSLPGRTTPEGNSDSLYVVPLITSVWPALWPPWKRTTMSACSESQSTILPLPSSPHWEPTTTTFAINIPAPPPARLRAPRPRRPNRETPGNSVAYSTGRREAQTLLPGGLENALRPPAVEHDRLVGRPAYPPSELDLAQLGRGRVERPAQHPAPVAGVALARRGGRRQPLDGHVRHLAHRQPVLDGDAHRGVVTVAHGDLDLALVGPGRRDDAGRAFAAAHDGAHHLDLVVGPEAQAHGLLLGGAGHVAAADIDVVAIERDPAGQERRILAVPERSLQVGHRIESRRRPHQQGGRERRGADAEALGAFVGADADAAG